MAWLPHSGPGAPVLPLSIHLPGSHWALGGHDRLRRWRARANQSRARRMPTKSPEGQTRLQLGCHPATPCQASWRFQPSERELRL